LTETCTSWLSLLLLLELIDVLADEFTVGFKGAELLGLGFLIAGGVTLKLLLGVFAVEPVCDP
jgi:hypothetical protein